MRFLPSSGTRTEAASLTVDVPQDKDITVSSNSNSNSSNSGVVLVDYSQYLKDSNLSFDRADIRKKFYLYSYIENNGVSL